MRVILFQSVANLGMAGQIVEVKPGYFRNYLEPRGLALRETPGAVRLLASKKRKIEQILLKEKSQAEEARNILTGIELTFTLKAGEQGRLFGSVTNKDIAEALKEKGIEVDRHKIELPEAIKTLGRHIARVRLHTEVIAELPFTVEREQASGVASPAASAATPSPESPAAAGEPSDAPAPSPAE